MKAQSHDRLFLYRFIVCITVFVNFLAVGKAHADLPPPTPPAIVQTIANTPHQMPLSGTLSVRNGTVTFRDPNPSGSARAAQYKSVGRALHGTQPDLLKGITGYKTHPIRLTNNYGQVATGQIRTATTVNSGTLDKAVTGLIGLNIIANILNSPGAHNAADALANGRYDEAALSAVAALDGISGIGSAANGLMDTYRQAQNAKTAALVAQHQQAAQTYEQVKNLPQVTVVYMSGRQGNGSLPYPGFGIYGVFPEPVYLSGGLIKSSNGHRILGHYPFSVDGLYVGYGVHNTPPTPEMFYKPVSPEELMLNQQEITQILLDQLHNNNSALNQNTQALTDLLNALVAGGHLDPSKQPTQVLGSPAENTFITPPFTPAGSDTAQQTQFVVNKDGSVTVSTINRPDLAAHTSQAPTRAEVGQQAPSPAETRDAKQGSTAEKPDICAQNPNSLMCADLGSGDYTDPVIPTHVVPMDFKPADIFDTNGVCPQPIGFEVMGKTFQMSYQPVCDFSAAIRPFVILGGMVLAMTLCYAAVRNM